MWDSGSPKAAEGFAICLSKQRCTRAASLGTLPTSCHRHPPEDVDAAIPISEEEHVVIVVPGDLIHLKLELFLCFGAMRLCVNEGDNIILVPHCNGLSIRAPTDVDVLP